MTDEQGARGLAPFNDPLDNPVSIRASLTESGVDAAAQSRTIAAIDNLCGSLIDAAGGAWLDGIRRRQRAKAVVKERVIYEEGEAQLEALRAERAAARFARELSRKQQAREAIAQLTFEAVKRLPALENKTPEAVANPELREDWMNSFSAFAENATEDSLRVLWARILAGEICSPGTFSRPTLRVISELETHVARAFAQIMPYRLPEGLFLYEEVVKEGVDMQCLIDGGLVQAQDVQAMAQEHDDMNFFLSGDWMLRINFDPRNTQSKFRPLISLPIMRLSGAGREIASAFELPNTRSTMIVLGSSLDEYSRKIELLHIVERSEAGLKLDDEDILIVREPKN